MTESPSSTSAASRASRTAVTQLAILIGLVGVADFAFGALYVNILLGVGLAPAQVGAGFFVAFLVSTVVEVPSGDWGDRWGQRRMTVLGLICWGTALIAFSAAREFPLVMQIALCVWAVGQALFSGAPIALTINQIPSTEGQLRRSAVRAASVSKWIGSAGGGLAVFFLANTFDPTTTVGAAGAVLVLLAAWTRVRWPESGRQVPPAAERHLIQRVRAGWAPGLGNLLTLAVVASMLLSVLLFTWQPLVAMAGVPIQTNGLLLLVMTVLAAGGAALSRFSDRLPGSPADVLIALLLASALMAVAGNLPGRTTTFVMLGATEVLTSYALTVVAVRAHSIFTDRFRNLLWSLFSASMGVAMAVSDLLFGGVWDRFGISTALAVAAPAVAAVAVVAWLIHIAISRRQASSGHGNAMNSEATRSSTLDADR